MAADRTSTNRARAAAGLEPAAERGGQELAPLERRIEYTRSLLPAFRDAVAQGLTPETLVRDAITALRNTPKLAECDAQSFAGALMSAAQLGLRPNVPSLGHGWVLPFWSGRRQRMEAQWILGYQGMIELGYKSGLVAKVTTDTIYRGETYRVRRGTADVLEHEPLLDPAERGEPISHYAVAWLQTGQALWHITPDADARAIMERFAARDRQKNIIGPWRDDYLAMARKTPLRALWRFMPKTPMLALALATDGVLREGTDRDASVTDDQGDTVASPMPAPSPAPARPDTVDADVVPDPPEPDEQPPAEPEPAAGDEQPGPFTMADGSVREAIAETVARRTYALRLMERQGPAKRMRATIEQVVGEYVPATHMTTAELRAAAAYEWGDE